MNPKAEIFFDAITLLPEDVVEEAQDHRFRKRPAVWKKLGSLAACLALIASLSLLALPRGCGSSGGNADMNTSGAPMTPAGSCEPADAPASADTAPAPEENDGQAEQIQFTATVIEIREDSILVEDGGEQIIVPTVGLELPVLAEGDTVRITHTGVLWTTAPAEILETVSIERVENDD